MQPQTNFFIRLISLQLKTSKIPHFTILSFSLIVYSDKNARAKTRREANCRWTVRIANSVEHILAKYTAVHITKCVPCSQIYSLRLVWLFSCSNLAGDFTRISFHLLSFSFFFTGIWKLKLVNKNQQYRPYIWCWQQKIWTPEFFPFMFSNFSRFDYKLKFESFQFALKNCGYDTITHSAYVHSNRSNSFSYEFLVFKYLNVCVVALTNVEAEIYKAEEVGAKNMKGVFVQAPPKRNKGTPHDDLKNFEAFKMFIIFKCWVTVVQRTWMSGDELFPVDFFFRHS